MCLSHPVSVQDITSLDNKTPLAPLLSPTTVFHIKCMEELMINAVVCCTCHGLVVSTGACVFELQLSSVACVQQYIALMNASVERALEMWLVVKRAPI